MPNKTRFQCPYCKVLFPVALNQKRFACPRCGHAFATVRLAPHQRGWMALPQVAWEQAHSQVIRPFPTRSDLRASALAAGSHASQPTPAGMDGGPPPQGAARLRRERRRKRRRAVLPLALISLAAVFLALMVYPRVVLGQGGSDLQGADYSASASTKLPKLNFSMDNAATRQASLAYSPTSGLTSTPSRTPTPTTTSTPTATATPLPAHLLQATAWQATLQQAADNSHATQTLVAGNYAATQTALPPTLTAMAQSRQATATQKAAEATARAAGPAVR
jgi:hypothetical protein